MIKHLFFIYLVTRIIQASIPTDDNYVVGVVEFSNKMNSDSITNLEYNLKGYEKLLQNNIKPNDEVDIIIFPESQLNSKGDEVTEFIPDPEKREVLCNEVGSEKRNFLNELSCWAAHYKKYMVFNLYEKANCTVKDVFCSDNGYWKYNTNVVFDRNGAVIARYRKYNLFYEHGIKPPKVAGLVTFETDFGVKFGTFICFDILFHDPSVQLVEDGVTDFVYPTMWFSELPFLTANQIQHGWSYSNDVNLLVSGANRPSVGSTGTGVFSGKSGTLKAVMNGKTTNEMYIVKVPKKNKKSNKINEQMQQLIKEEKEIKAPSQFPERIRGVKLKRESTLDMFQIEDLNLSIPSLKTEKTVCHNDFCCSFFVEIAQFPMVDDLKSYNYKLAVYSGKRHYSGPVTGWEKVCSVISCTDDKNIATCGTVFGDEEKLANRYYFKNIEIKGNLPKDEKMLIIPTTVNQLLEPSDVDNYDFNVEINQNNTYDVTMKLKQSNSDLLTFGIYSLYYDGFVSTKINFIDHYNNNKNNIKD